MTKNKSGAVPLQQRRPAENSVDHQINHNYSIEHPRYKTPAETLGWIRRLGGQLHATGDNLSLVGVDSPPADLLKSISNHKIKLHQLVTAARGQWPGWDQD